MAISPKCLGNRPGPGLLSYLPHPVLCVSVRAALQPSRSQAEGGTKTRTKEAQNQDLEQVP